MKITKKFRKEVSRGILGQFRYDAKRWMQKGFGREDVAGEAWDSSFEYCKRGTAVCMCIGGAAIQAGYKIAQMDDVARALGFKESGEMYRWNDNPKRTFEQIITRVEKALV